MILFISPHFALVVQWIELLTPNEAIHVRLMARALRYTVSMDIDTSDSASMSDQIEEIRMLVRENNKLLKKIRRDAIIGGILKIVLWILVILASLYFSTKFLEPYLGMLQSATEQPKAPQNIGDINAFIEQYKGLLGE